MQDKDGHAEIRNDDIAIIGMSGRFPEADNLHGFWQNILTGKESIRRMPESRQVELREILGEVEMGFNKAGYLDQITFFEPEVFALSREEARYMDPQQRLVLELVEEAVLDAGYNPSKLAELEVGVYITANRTNYTKEINYSSPLAYVSTLGSASAGRIAYLYDLHGPVLTLDTACSSAMVAVHTACQNLRCGECEMAIVGGAELILKLPGGDKNNDFALISPTESIRPFDKDADGTVAGEGGGVVLLKLLSKAVKDRDNIYAVIKGSAVNNDGGWSNGITVPSRRGQAEVICKALDRGRLKPENITYIEGNGIGTRLGDPIEIEGIQEAFKKYEYAKNTIPLGTVKPNIGHLNKTAGMASLIKTVLALHYKTLPPTIHFWEANPLIDFRNSPVYVNTTVQEWVTTEPRRAGVSSIGMTGTNVFMVLEEFFDYQERDMDRKDSHTIILSARTEYSLRKMVNNLQQYLKDHNDIDLRDIACTLNTGRRVFPLKIVLTASSTEEFLKELEKVRFESDMFMSGESLTFKPIFILPDIFDFDLQSAEQLYVSNPIYRKIYQELMYSIIHVLPIVQSELDYDGLTVEPGISDVRLRSKVIYLCSIYSLTETLKTYGLNPEAVLGLGSGDILADLLREDCTLSEAVARLHEFSEQQIEFTEERLAITFNNIANAGFDLFVMIMPGTEFGGFCTNILEKTRRFGLAISDKFTRFSTAIQQCIAQGIDINWEKVYQLQNPYRISLPGYVFDRQSYFAKPDFIPTEVVKVKHNIMEEIMREGSEVFEDVMRMFAEVYPENDINLDAGFLDYGLNSISILHLIGKIKREYNVAIPVEIFFENRTLREVLELITQTVTSKAQGQNLIIPQPKQDYYPASSAQKRLYALQQLAPDSTGYNLPEVLIIEGDLDRERFDKAFQQLIHRHESLRTSFHVINEEIVQVIHEDVQFAIEYFSATEDDCANLIDQMIRPFDLSKPRLIRVGLIKLSPEKHMLVYDLHHIISDGVSKSILINELLTFYQHDTLLKPPLSELTIQYRDFAVWQQEYFATEEFKKHEEYWLSVFEDNIPLLDLPTDYPRQDVVNFSGEMCRHELDGEFVEKLKQLAREYDASLYMIMLTAYYILLAKYSGQEDIVVGSPITGRPHADLEQVIGAFVNMLAIRNYPKRNMTVHEFIQAVRISTLNAFKHQDYQIIDLVNKLKVQRHLGRNPLFDVAFAMQNMEREASEVEGLTFKPYKSEHIMARFDLTLFAIPLPDRIILLFRYLTTIFKSTTIEQLATHYIEILHQMVANPNGSIEEITLSNDLLFVTTHEEDVDFAF